MQPPPPHPRTGPRLAVQCLKKAGEFLRPFCGGFALYKGFPAGRSRLAAHKKPGAGPAVGRGGGGEEQLLRETLLACACLVFCFSWLGPGCCSPRQQVTPSLLPSTTASPGLPSLPGSVSRDSERDSQKDDIRVSSPAIR